MSVTIKEIAKEAGVSRGTVDRALNNRPGVNAEVAERIRRLAEEMGYQPNRVAKALVDRNYTHYRIGIILVTENNSFYNDIIRGAEDCLKEYEDYNAAGELRVLTSYSDEDGMISLINGMTASGVQGIVLTPIGSPKVTACMRQAESAGVRFITVNSDVEGAGRSAYVGSDFRKSGKVMAGLVRQLSGGHAYSIGAVTGPSGNTAVQQREDGFLEEIGRYEHLKLVSLVRNEENEEKSYELTAEMLENHPELEAVCFLGAGMVGSLKALSEAKAEQNRKVLVYDAYPEILEGLQAGLIDFSITQEPYEQGYRSVKLLLEELLFGNAPEREYNYTKLSVITGECL